MKYVEMTVEEAMKKCNKNTKVLVAIQDLEKEDDEIVFVQKKKREYGSIFEDAKMVMSMCDDFMKQLNVFTEQQPNIPNILPRGYQKIVLLKE